MLAKERRLHRFTCQVRDGLQGFGSSKFEPVLFGRSLGRYYCCCCAAAAAAGVLVLVLVRRPQPWRLNAVEARLSGERCRDAQLWQSGELLKLRLLCCVCDQRAPQGKRRKPDHRPRADPERTSSCHACSCGPCSASDSWSSDRQARQRTATLGVGSPVQPSTSRRSRPCRCRCRPCGCTWPR